MKASWLYSKHPITVDPDVATVLGLSQSVVLQQLNYWLHSKIAKFIDGRYWVYNTYDGWHDDNFPFMSKSTVIRCFKELEEKGIVITGNFNRLGIDKTKWYSIDEDKLDQIMGMTSPSTQNEQTRESKRVAPSTQNDHMEELNLTTPLPETNQRVTTENNNMSKSKDLHVSVLQKEFDVLWGMYPKYKKQGKQKAFSSYGHWRKASKENTFERAKTQLSKYLKYIKIKSVPTEYIKAAKTWFANIDDEYDLSPAPTQYQRQGYGQKRVEKGTDWSKKKAKAPSSDVHADELKNYFKDLEESTGVSENE